MHIYTGEGKGKTTAAIGLSVRAAGQGVNVLIVQFFKEDMASSGEKNFFAGSPSVEILRSNCRHPIFTGKDTDLAGVKRSVVETFERAKKTVMEGSIGLLVLDEAMSAINGGWIGVDEMMDFLDKRPPGLEVVLTGRSAPVELIKAADYVTEMLKIKHPFDEDIAARKGIEF
ncbi:MAG: cob(I)yrinic acid a,c-diamide adenosyltransferase [Deltaproteobacteria bacterium]|nr:cob(I)yrinic acid a,c-diamide adenosyltransferase [Deltaproteobacteria bacterium]